MKYWVSMTDRFMSNWKNMPKGPDKLVIECENKTQAMQIESAANRRSEMKYISIGTSRPTFPRAAQVTYRHYDDMGKRWKE